MTALPRISIVVPNLNSGAALARALQSIFDQDYPALQLIVADAGSTDESASILEMHKDRIDVILREKDAGQADGLNRGFRRADGGILCWLCADDELLPGALRHIANLFAEHPEAGVIAGATERVFGDSFTSLASIRPDAWHVLTVRNTLEQPSVFWRAEWGRAGDLDTRFHLAFDWEYWCRLKQAGARLLITERVLSRYHFSRTNKTSIGGTGHVDEGYRIIRRYGPHYGLIARIFRLFYFSFDLRGCMDHPPTAPAARMLIFRAVRLLCLASLGGVISEYNWHFASLQQRGLDWWEGERRLLERREPA